MNGYGAIGQEKINDLVREAAQQRLARTTRRSRNVERSSLARLVMAGLHAVVRH